MNSGLKKIPNWEIQITCSWRHFNHKQTRYVWLSCRRTKTVLNSISAPTCSYMPGRDKWCKDILRSFRFRFESNFSFPISNLSSLLIVVMQPKCTDKVQFFHNCIGSLHKLFFFHYTGWSRNNGTVDTVDFSGLFSNQQLFSSPCWIEHLFPIILTPRSSNLVDNFLFYETFLMDCHFRDLPDFQSFEARWQINGKSQKWQSIRNYS